MVKSSSHNITIIGSGYVGMSLATLLSQYHKVTIVDIDKEKVKKITKKDVDKIDFKKIIQENNRED